MMSKNKSNVNKVLNPFLGFGWSTGFATSKNRIKTITENKNQESLQSIKK